MLRKSLTIKGLRRAGPRKSLIVNDLGNFCKSLIINRLGGGGGYLLFGGFESVTKIKFDFSLFFPYVVGMITIIRNINFSNWVNINVDGKMVDNAPNYAKAMQIAQRLQKNNKLPIIKK